MVYISAWAIAFLFLVVFQCHPIYSYWNIHDSDTNCLVQLQVPLYLVHGLANLLADVVVLILPIHTIIKLHLPRGQKAGLIFVFGLGSM